MQTAPARPSRFLRTLPMLTAMGVIFFFSHLPGQDLPDMNEIIGFDKLVHAIVYAGLTLTVLFAFLPVPAGASPWRTMAMVAAICLMFAISDEYHQSFVAGRTASGWDVLADMFGISAMIAFWIRKTRTTDRQA